MYNVSGCNAAVGFVFTPPDSASTCIKRDIRVYTISHFTYMRVWSEKTRLCACQMLPLSHSFSLSISLYIYYILVTPSPYFSLSLSLLLRCALCISIGKSSPIICPVYYIYIILLPRTDNIIITDYDGKNIYGGKAGTAKKIARNVYYIRVRCRSEI